MKRTVATYFSSLAMAFALASPSHADEVESFYKSHPLTLIMGYAPGGGFDLYGRSVARYIGKHMPGQPKVIVQNMPGAGSVVASNYMYSVAPKDGSAISMVRAPVMDVLTGTPRSEFDARKFTWLGNGMSDLTLCAQLNNPLVKTVADAEKYPFTMVSLGPGSDEDMFIRVLNDLFHWKDKIVSGYSGSAEAVLAIARGEADGRCGWSYASLMITNPKWITEKKLHILAALSLARSPNLPDTPSIMEFATTDREKQILKVLIGSEELARPFLAPPDIPPERAAALRKAFADTMADPAFIAERKAFKETVNQSSWQDTNKMIQELYDTPKGLIKETKAMVETQ